MKNLLLALSVAILLLLAVRIAAAKQGVPFIPRTETIQAEIATVDVPDHLLIVKSADGVFYNFKVQPSTVIVVGGEKTKLEDLAGKSGKEVSVTFRVLRNGNFALKVEVR
jgi:hypothetical protein